MEQTLDLLQSKGGIIAIFALGIVILERLFPAVRPLAKAHLDSIGEQMMRWTKNLSFILINAALSPLLVIPLSVLAAHWALPWRPEYWSGWSGLVLDLLLLDLWIYWWHRANHELPFLWRFHEVHHLDEFLDASTAVRFHFGEVLLSALVRAGVIVILAVPLASVVVFETLLLIATLFHHSNVKLRPGFEQGLARIVVTPSIHWVHHHAVKADTDSNYSTVLSVWDLIFGTRSRTRRSATMPIGVEARIDEGLIRLLSRPFRQLMR